MTFSIVAWDPSADPPEWGVSVASKFLAVGAVVGWAKAGSGALATQAFANLAYGPEGIARLDAGKDAAEVVEHLTTADDQRDHRQLGVVDSRGKAATFTGAECFDWAGGRAGDGYCCQGNILAGPEVVDDMVAAFGSSDGDLADRMVASLAAADAAGGDRRGRQSASVLVVREGGGYGGGIDKAIDLRVDDHPAPIPELRRLLDLHRLYFPRPQDLDFISVDDPLSGELRNLVSAAGYDPGSGTGYTPELKAALFAYVGTENLEERWVEDERIERGILDHLRDR